MICTIAGSTQSAETVVNSDSGGKVLDDQLIGIIVGSLAALILLIVTIFIFMFIVRRRKNKYNANGNHASKMHDAKAQQRVLLNLNDLRTLTSPSKVSNGNYTSVATCEDLTEKMNGSPYREPFDVIQARQLPELPDTPDFSGEFMCKVIDLSIMCCCLATSYRCHKALKM